MERIITYSLLRISNFGIDFYSDLQFFTDVITKKAIVSLGNIVDEYRDYVEKNDTENPRTFEEYLLELIMMGILWQNYSPRAQKTGYFSEIFLKHLYALRKKNETLKPVVDKVRGYIAYKLLLRKAGEKSTEYSFSSYHRLLLWLSATGEFNEEVIRLKNWEGFLSEKTEVELGSILYQTTTFALFFQETGRDYLGKYILNVDAFLKNKLREYKFREDYFFAGRKDNEYLLNMFGAEVMNRKFRDDFKKTKQKAILLPTCMRTPPASGCKAKSDGKELVCSRCNSQCNVGKVAAFLEKYKVVPYLIPHSSDFSRFLRKWENNKETGLIGVACVLNLLTGGYEMKRLGIASQCVFLDYCGCKKHWDKTGFPTDLNLYKLEKILQADSIV